MKIVCIAAHLYNWDVETLRRVCVCVFLSFIAPYVLDSRSLCIPGGVCNDFHSIGYLYTESTGFLPIHKPCRFPPHLVSFYSNTSPCKRSPVLACFTQNSCQLCRAEHTNFTIFISPRLSIWNAICLSRRGHAVFTALCVVSLTLGSSPGR